jgi:cytochrome P450
MHRREDVFGKDPEQFDPERWDPERCDTEHGTNLQQTEWKFLPFHGGPRTCLGKEFATLEVSYVTVRLVQHFKAIAPGDERPWIELYTLVLSSKNGTWVSITPDTQFSFP